MFKLDSVVGCRNSRTEGSQRVEICSLYTRDAFKPSLTKIPIIKETNR